MSYRIFDSHTHAFPDAIAERATASLAEKSTLPRFTNGTFDGLLAFEAAGGADGFALLPIATRPSQTHSVNLWAASRRGLGGCVPFGSVHPASPDAGTELDELCALGLTGVKLHPEYQEFYADDPALFPFYREIFRRGLILHLHAGEDLGFSPPVRGAPERIAAICDAFPDATIIAAHMGSFHQWDAVEACLAGRPNLWMDTSFAADWMSSERFCRLARRHGIERILFGTDSPWTDFTKARDAVICSGLTEAELRAVFWENAAKLYRL